ncbi:hypothetical protein CAOG_03247 [Capsaspora owczarzaki ATCC 30864]|uniref:Uncharacterized protein n=1 Tax=Capsaspora owczarzaki (strain ATCC 30864) TaxID=595528 RepID=A0A0D2WNZ0_CAPO3|nr:hypothetical protein CAOG_03247 [Capsaspora owczarzaki ATCC 30864]KJE92243.1 hypothetical protein CAOG_003247 [Capsaspora owczarzaki ATCC 30864]|eukprot:XP_004364086.1 hypothetical protein CAOG_03247 [Capsaspora owczarzaki ATCC 30864]
MPETTRNPAAQTAVAARSHAKHSPKPLFDSEGGQTPVGPRLALALIWVVIIPWFHYYLPPVNGRLKFNPYGMVFLTAQSCHIMCVYNIVLLIAAVFHLDGLAKFVSRHFRGLAFTLGMFIGIGYYALVHWSPLVRARAAEVPHFDTIMHLMHGLPPLIALADVYVHSRAGHKLLFRSHVYHCVGYAVFYLAWSVYCVQRNDGVWPYPFQNDFTHIAQHIAFNSFVFVALAGILRGGVALCDRVFTQVKHAQE